MKAESRALGALRIVLMMMTARRKRQFAATFALTIASGLAEMLSVGAVIPFLALVVSPDSLHSVPLLGQLAQGLGLTGGREALLPAVAFLAGAAVVAGIIRLAALWMTTRFVLELSHDIGVDIFRRTLAQPYAALMARNTSELVAAVEKVQVVAFAILLPVVQGALALVVALFIIVLLVAINPAVSLAAAAILGAVYLIISLATRRVLERNSATLAATQTRRIKLVQEGLGGIRDIIIDQSQPVFEEQFRRFDRAYREAQIGNVFISGAPRFVVEATGIVLIALVALLMSRQPGGVAAAIPVIGALALGAQRLLPLVQQGYLAWSSLTGNEQALLDVTELLQLPVSTDAGARPAPQPFERDICFAAVDFHYGGRRAAAVTGLDFAIAKGEWVGIVGKTGSGKSTLLDLMMGLIEPSEGVIAIDGAPLTAANRAAWQARIAHVPQHIFLSDDSLAANIAFGVEPGAIDRGRVRDAAARAQIDEFIDNLPDGYDTIVGERGVRLSGGQRQRIGLARALYKQADVLILDEATSALDQDTERAVIDALGALDRSITLVMIAHRPSTLEGCDMVLRMDGGQIIAIDRRQRGPAASQR
jgi:ABC-type bacteriocin/lantibiotic exporter with double-glycine peptidase domain